MKVIPIIFGALFTALTAWCLGMILLRRLHIELHRLEEGLLAFIVGSACLSELMFALAALHMVRTWVLVIGGTAALAGALWVGALRPASKGSLPSMPRPAWLLWGVVFVAFAYWYLGQALSPEFSPDGSTYHLGLVQKYFHAKGFVRIPTNMYASLSQGLELLFLFAFSFGRHSSAALVHLAFLVCSSLLMICYGRRIGYPWVGASAAIFFYASPVVGMDASIAYNDVAVATVLFSIFYLLELWDDAQASSLLIPIGILAGWAYAIKYTAALAIPYALGFVVWRLTRTHKLLLRPVLLVTALAALFVSPWMIKNAMWVSNPVAPFANRLFPNPYVHVSLEEQYRRFMKSYGIDSYAQVPLDLTVHGFAVTGLFGPLFLLTPLMLLAARKREGRRLLFAALLFALPYATNIGARFLIPAAPFVSLALAVGLAGLPGFPIALPVFLAILHAVSCWPDVLEKYCDRYAWHIHSVSWEAALRIEPQDAFLRRNLNPEYPMARMIEQSVPVDGKVFEFGESASAYTDRFLLGRYTGAFNEVVADILWNPLFPDMQARVLESFRFPTRQVRKMRIVQTAKMGPVSWSIAEVRLYQAGQELARASAWRLTANPNPWDVQMAFDASPVTRWRTWQGGEPGMFIEVDLGANHPLDAVTVLTSQDCGNARLLLEVSEGDGHWVTVQAKPVESTVLEDLNLRKLATEEVKRRGVEYLVVKDSDIGAKDFRDYAPQWGIQELKLVGDLRLYKIR